MKQYSESDEGPGYEDGPWADGWSDRCGLKNKGDIKMFPGFELPKNDKEMHGERTLPCLLDVSTEKRCPECDSSEVIFLYSISDGMRMNDQNRCKICGYEWED